MNSCDERDTRSKPVKAVETVASERMPERSGRSLIEQNPSSLRNRVVGSGDGQALFGVLQNGFGLLADNAGKPVEKIIEPGAVLQVCKEGLDGDSCSSEDPGSADLCRISFDGRALVPVKHRERLRDAMNGRQAVASIRALQQPLIRLRHLLPS
jgi:hypothetical protein